VDDLVDTAGTLCVAAQGLMDKGARSIYACVTHGLLSGPALDRIQNSPIKEIIITDTIPPRPDIQASPKVRVLPVAPLLGEAVRRIHLGDSLSSLFI
jgi:ribose-phosphate pyrophosphokinase